MANASITNLIPVQGDTRQFGGSGDGGQMYTRVSVIKNDDLTGKPSPISEYFLPMPRELEGAGVFSMDWQQEELGADFLNAMGQRIFGSQGPGMSSLNEAGGAIGRFGAETAAGVGLGGMGTEAQRQAGVAKNPINTLVFRNANLRQFQFTWDFIPIDSSGAQRLKTALSQLRANMHPELGGFGYINPNLFGVEIKIKGQILFASERAALTNLIINPYGSGLPSFHKDGNPVHTTVTMEFQEIYPNTKSYIQQLYGG